MIRIFQNSFIWKKSIFLFFFVIIPLNALSIDFVKKDLYDKQLEFTQQKNFLQRAFSSFSYKNTELKEHLKRSKEVNIPLDKYCSSRLSYQEFQIVIENVHHVKIHLLVKGYQSSFGLIFILNGVVFSPLTQRTVDQMNQKLKKTFRVISAIDCFLQKDAKTLTIQFSNLGSSVKILSTPWVYRLLEKIDKKLNKIQKKITLLKKNKTFFHSPKWEQPWLRKKVPLNFLKHLENEMLEVDNNDDDTIKLTAYLQILKILKMSGYIFSDDTFEQKILKKITQVYQGPFSKKQLYFYLSQKKGVEKVLEQKLNKITHYVFFDSDTLRDFFIVKKKDFYMRHEEYNKIKIFLKNAYREYQKLDNQSEEGFVIKHFLQEISNLRKSCGRLTKFYANNSFFQKKYSSIKKICDQFFSKGSSLSVLEKIQQEKKIFLDDFQKKTNANKKSWIFFILLFQDIIFYQDQLESVLNRKTLNNFFNENLENIISEIKQQKSFLLGLSHDSNFSIAQLNFFYNIKMCYSSLIKFPVMIDVDQRGKHILKMDTKIFSQLAKHVSINVRGAKLWVQYFLFSALLRATGIHSEQLGIILFDFISQNVSQDKSEDLLFYFEHHMLENLWKNKRFIQLCHQKKLIKYRLKYRNLNTIKQQVDRIFSFIFKVFQLKRFSDLGLEGV